MSYVRQGTDSDVYVYLHCDGYLHCCGCPWLGSFEAMQIKDMLSHLRAHVVRGDKVPERVFSGLHHDSKAIMDFIRKHRKARGKGA